MAEKTHGAVRKALWGLPLMLLPAAGAWADSFDWRNATVAGVTGNYVTPVENQGAAGTCWAFAAVGILEAKFDIANHNPNLNLDLSEQHLVSAGVGTVKGGDPGAALWYFVMNGITDEATLPYTGLNPSPLWPLKPPYDLYGVTDVRTWLPADPKDVKADLKQFGPLVVAINAAHDLISHQPDATTVVTNKGGYALDHAVDIIGYQDDTNAAGGGYYIVKNSWGTAVGDNGFFYLTYATVQADGVVMGIDGSTWVVDPPILLGAPSPVTVPEPISMIFFGTGLVAVGGYVARRRMQRT